MNMEKKNHMRQQKNRWRRWLIGIIIVCAGITGTGCKKSEEPETKIVEGKQEEESGNKKERLEDGSKKEKDNEKKRKGRNSPSWLCGRCEPG